MMAAALVMGTQTGRLFLDVVGRTGIGHHRTAMGLVEEWEVERQAGRG